MKPLGGILEGTDRIINQHLLGLDYADGSERSYRHKGEFSKLRSDFNAEQLLRELIKEIQKNLNRRSTSEANWREGSEAIQPNLDTSSTSMEVILERKIAQVLKKTHPQQDSPWWNQMPIASGIKSSSADRRRAIDLVHRYEDGKQYDFVELKIGSDTPLFALTEILRYGLVYLVLRENQDWLYEDTRAQPVFPIFNAEIIGLRVLAPQEYYKQDLSWIEDKINQALRKVIGELNLSLPLAMNIGSYFHDRLKHDQLKKILDEEIPADLLSVLVDWKPAYPL